MEPTAICSCLLTNLALEFASPVNAAAWIVRDGRAQAEIVIAERSAHAAELGASKLQTYIEKEGVINDVM